MNTFFKCASLPKIEPHHSKHATTSQIKDDLIVQAHGAHSNVEMFQLSQTVVVMFRQWEQEINHGSKGLCKCYEMSNIITPALYSMGGEGWLSDADKAHGSGAQTRADLGIQTGFWTDDSATRGALLITGCRELLVRHPMRKGLTDSKYDVAHRANEQRLQHGKTNQQDPDIGRV
jgi:hypothetical protein